VTTITLNEEQSAAEDAFVQFLADPDEQVFVIEGYSGTGKSTLIDTLMKRLDGYIKKVEETCPNHIIHDVALTATTNKAAENFARITGREVRTIHSYMGFRVHQDYETGAKKLVATREDEKITCTLIFIDEASYLDSNTLGMIFRQVENCKIVFIGDPAQLLAVRSFTAPVFKAGFRTARLSKTMRQMVNGVPQENKITELATAFRHTVNTGIWPTNFKPDGEFIIWAPRSKFKNIIEAEFLRDDWVYHDSKILAYRNETVIAYNKHIRALKSGEPMLEEGDYAENNHYIRVGKDGIRTDATVFISKIEPESEEYGEKGHWVEVDYQHRVFHPHDRSAKTRLAARFRAAGNFRQAVEVESWIDLRAVFSQTVNKSQGSTYKRVYLDLDDIRRCTHGNQIARLMYVGISRAQLQVFMTGDLV
jgi:hypothetical protein